MEAQVALGEWQAQGSGGLEAGVGGPRGAAGGSPGEGGLLGRGAGRWERVPPGSPAWGCSSGLCLPSPLCPCPCLRLPRAPRIVLSGKPERQSRGQSSAPDTRWLSGSLRFFPRAALASSLLPSGGSSVPVLGPRSSVLGGVCGSPGGPARGHGTAPRPGLPGTGFQAKPGGGRRSGPLAGGTGAQPCAPGLLGVVSPSSLSEFMRPLRGSS